MPRPIPRAAPVTSATLPFSLKNASRLALKPPKMEIPDKNLGTPRMAARDCSDWKSSVLASRSTIDNRESHVGAQEDL